MDYEKLNNKKNNSRTSKKNRNNKLLDLVPICVLQLKLALGFRRV